MKKSLLLLAIFIPAVASANEHTFTANVGGGFNASFFFPYNTTNYNDVALNQYESESLGGGFNIEMGYIWMSSGALIHALDSRLGFGQNYSTIYQIDKGSLKKYDEEYKLESTFAYVGTTYSLGRKHENITYLVDIIGVNLGWIQSTLSIDGSLYNMGSNLLVSANLPGGTSFIFDEGLSLSFRHRLDFAFGGEPTWGTHGIDSGSYFGSGSDQTGYLAYNLTVSVGYSFGL